MPNAKHKTALQAQAENGTEVWPHLEFALSQVYFAT